MLPESGVESAALICRTIKSAATGRDLERYSIRERRDMHGDTRETVLSPHGRLAAVLAERSVAVQNATNSLLTRLPGGEAESAGLAARRQIDRIINLSAFFRLACAASKTLQSAAVK